jgi:hypothetical protein
MSVSYECCVLSGRGLCSGPIPRPEETYRVCMCLRVIEEPQKGTYAHQGYRAMRKKNEDMLTLEKIHAVERHALTFNKTRWKPLHRIDAI